MSLGGIARGQSLLVQIRSEPDVILMAIVLPDSVQLQAGVFTLEMSSTSVMSRPATGFGTDGVIATSLAAHGPDGIATAVGSSDLFWWCWPVADGPTLPAEPKVDASADGLVSATFRAASAPEDPSLEPPSIFASPTTSSVAMPSSISRRTQ